MGSGAEGLHLSSPTTVIIQQAVSWRPLEDESLFQGGFMVKERNKEA
jgi:hypothetical protein